MSISDAIVVRMNPEDELREWICQVEHSNGEPHGNLILPTEDLVLEINVGTNEEPCPIFVSLNMNNEALLAYTLALKEFRDVSSWSYDEMPGLDPSAAIHCLNIKPGMKPHTQK